VVKITRRKKIIKIKKKVSYLSTTVVQLQHNVRIAFSALKTPQKTELWQRCLLPGIDVMATIFCDFCQFSAKKMRFSQKPML
jgi:hypothetical protein